jgi:hypothetical protein
METSRPCCAAASGLTLQWTRDTDRISKQLYDYSTRCDDKSTDDKILAADDLVHSVRTTVDALSALAATLSSSAF